MADTAVDSVCDEPVALHYLEAGAVQQTETSPLQRPPTRDPQVASESHKQDSDHHGGAQPEAQLLENPEIVQEYEEANACEQEEGHRSTVLPQTQLHRTALAYTPARASTMCTIYI